MSSATVPPATVQNQQECPHPALHREQQHSPLIVGQSKKRDLAAATEAPKATTRTCYRSRMRDPVLP